MEYLLPMPAFTKIIVLYNFKYKKLSKPCTQLYKQPVLYLSVNASMGNTIYSKSGVFRMPAFTKSTSFQTLETFQTMYITIGIQMSTISPLFTSKYQHGQYHTLKVEYLLPMLAFTKIIVLYLDNFRYKKFSETMCCTRVIP